MRKMVLMLMAGIAAVSVVVTVFALQSSDEVLAAKIGGLQIDLLVELPPGGSAATLVSNIGSSGLDGVSGKCSPDGTSSFIVDSFFDVSYVSNIGSSGLDGVRYSFDSFFDVEYSLGPGERAGGFDTEILSMDLKASLVGSNNPGHVMDDLRCQVETAGGKIIEGHVTVLK